MLLLGIPLSEISEESLSFQNYWLDIIQKHVFVFCHY